MRLFEKLKARGQSSPLDDLPKIEAQDADAWQCFLDLDHARRDSSGVVKAISPTDVCAWLDLNCVADEEDRLQVFNAVMSMDKAWFKKRDKVEAAAAAAAKDKKNAKPSSRNRRAQGG